MDKNRKLPSGTRLKILAAFVVLLIAVSPAGAQEMDEPVDESTEQESGDLFTDPFADVEGEDESDDAFDIDDPDSFFTEEDMFEQIDTETGANPEMDLLVRENTRIGGRFSSTFEALSVWEDYPDGDTIFDPTDSRLLPRINARIFVDARPEDDFRFYSRFHLDYPFSVDALAEDGVGVVSVPSIEVFELFTDFSWKKTLFFRIGKSVVNWGVGYFYSPADVISLASIDPEDPDADREGPVSFQTHLPFDVHNAYLYLIAGDSIANDGKIEVAELAVAPKLELFFGGVEYGVGAFYQKDLSPRGMATIGTSVWDFDLFAEGVMSYGSDRTFIRRTGNTFVPWETYTRDDEVFFEGTAGFRYANANLDANIIGQYYFNGSGYTDVELLSDARANLLALAAGTAEPIDLTGGTLSPGDFRQANRHYATAVGSLTELFGTDLSAALLWQGNLSDGSGLVGPSLTYRLFERASVSAAATVAYGPDEREFTSFGARTSASVSVSLGSGSF